MGLLQTRKIIQVLLFAPLLSFAIVHVFVQYIAEGFSHCYNSSGYVGRKAVAFNKMKWIVAGSSITFT